MEAMLILVFTNALFLCKNEDFEWEETENISIRELLYIILWVISTFVTE